LSHSWSPVLHREEEEEKARLEEEEAIRKQEEEDALDAAPDEAGDMFGSMMFSTGGTRKARILR
jgi:hypothetical protein